MKKRFFEEAKKESHLSDYAGAHLGAVAVYKDKFIIAKAHNSSKTSPTQYFYNRYRKDEKNDIMDKPPRNHAETALCKKLIALGPEVPFDKITVYIYREHKDGTLALARSCPSCEKMLHDLGIRTICYTVTGGYKKEKFYKEIKK